MNLGNRFDGRLICVTGIDGAGKTTICREVANALNERDEDAKYVYGKYLPRLLLPFMWGSRLLFLRGTDQFEDYDEHTAQKDEAVGGYPLLATLYMRIMLLDYVLQLLIRVCIPLFRGKTVVCDRYVFDTIIVDIADDFGLSTEDSFRLIGRLLEWYPAPDRTVLIDVPEEVSMERKDDIPASAYLRTRRRRYLQFASRFEITVVDGTESVDDVADAVLDECRQ